MISSYKRLSIPAAISSPPPQASLSLLLNHQRHFVFLFHATLKRNKNQVLYISLECINNYVIAHFPLKPFMLVFLSQNNS